MGRKRKAWRPGRLPRAVRWREGRRLRQRTFDTVTRAREYQRSLQARLDTEGADGLVEIELSAAIEAFGDHVGPTVSPDTSVDMAGCLARFEALLGARRHVGSITGVDLDRYVQACRHMTRKATGGREVTISDATVAKHVRFLRRFFRWSTRRGYCPGDPTRDLSVRVKSRPRDIGPLPSDLEIGRLVRAAPDVIVKVGLMLSVTTGLDRGVIARLRAENLDQQNGCLVVMRPKTGKRLVVPVHTTIMTEVAAALARADLGMYPLARFAHRRWWSELRRLLGAPWDLLRIADLRKIASGRLQRVLPLTQVQRLLGHSSPLTTAAHYSPLDPAVLQAFDTLLLPWSRTRELKIAR